MSERVDIGFGDAERSLHGLVRASGEGLLFADGALHELAGVTLDGPHVAVPGKLELELEPLGEAAGFADGGSHQTCQARGSVLGRTVELLATRAAMPAPPAKELVRDVAARLGDRFVFALRAHRGARARHHDDEQLEAFVLRAEDDAGPAWSPIGEPLLSTTYDGHAAVLRAGVELWETEESPFPLRLGGEVVASAQLGESRVALCLWHHAGLTGSGHYVLDGA